MGEVENLEKELKELEETAERDKKIKDLKSKIHAKKFAQSKSGKIFNKIADIGEGLGKAMQGDPNKPKAKVKSLKEVMENLPQ
jgi:hypothetical protein